jgi:hypothetical protein
MNNLTDSLSQGNDYKIPEWCGLPEEDHQDPVKQCLGIVYGDVEKEGHIYCRVCQFNKEINSDDEN